MKSIFLFTMENFLEKPAKTNKIESFVKYLGLRISIILAIQALSLYFYVGFFGVNLYSKETLFVKGEQEIILLGVSHIAEKEYYESINRRYSDKYIVLLEGLNGTTEEDSISHEHSAKILGLAKQTGSFLKHLPHKNVDIHIDEIDDGVYKAVSSSFDVWKHIAMFNFDKAKNSFKEVKTVSLTNIYDEIIIKRNEKIKVEILANSNNLIIPWGAIHQNDIEDFLKENGFKKKETSFIKIASIPKVIYNSVSYFLQ